jgi:hypothetical protein
MNERFAGIEGKQDRQASLEARLNRHPILKARMEALLDVVENTAGDLDKANAAEQRVIEQLQRMGNEVLHGWATNQERKKSEELEKSEQRVRHKEKKTSIGTRASVR